MFLTVLATLLAGLLVVLPWAQVDPEARTLFLFLGLLPMVNGVFDFLSYAVTLTLIQRGHGKGWRTVLYALIDLACAALLFLLLGCTLIVLAVGVNRLTGLTFVDVPQVFAGLSDWRASGWIWLMVFSTMLPTAAHFALAAAGSLFGPPRGMTTWLAGLVNRAGQTPWAMIAAPLAMTLVTLGWLALLGLVVLFFLAPLSLTGLAEVPWLGWIEVPARAYFGLFARFAVWIGALPDTDLPS